MTETYGSVTARPDSSMDRTARAAAQAAPVITQTGQEEAGSGPAYIVPIRDEPPALGIGAVVLLTPADPVQLLLPQDPRRRTAIVLAIDNDVYLATSKELAQAAVGTVSSPIAGYLPAGIAVPIGNRAAWYAAATTTASPTRITVLISKDEE
jgi:hypothetical protein